MDDKKKNDLSDLTAEDLEELCILAESEIKNFIHSKCPPKKIKNLEIIVEFEFEKTKNLIIDIVLESVSLSEEENKILAEEAVRVAMNAIDKKLLG